MAGVLWQQGADELLDELRELERRRWRDHAAMLDRVAELDARGLAGGTGYPSLAELLRDTLRISTHEARRRIAHARALTETPLVSGGTVPAALPATAAALRAGDLGPEHVEVIVTALGGPPPHVPAADVALAERSLVDAAVSLDGHTLRRVASRLREVLDQDGAPPDDRELAEPVNELHLHTRRDGRLVVRGEFEPEAAALITTALSPLARPRPADDAGPDPRSTAGRNGDALVELVRLAADGGGLPSEGGEKPHVLVTIPFQVLRAGRGGAGFGRAVLDGVGPIDAESARRIACDAKVVPAVLGSRSEPLDLGRASHTVPTALRRALVLRDGGCAFPGCDRSHRWCHSHHIRHWADDGPTDLHNLVLLCGRHHRLIHHSDWDCAMAHGRPEFRPPRFVDPDRTPRRNLLHDHLRGWATQVL